MACTPIGDVNEMLGISMVSEIGVNGVELAHNKLISGLIPRFKQ
jgi:hypothetical protein